jgi:hypothetical protein
MVEKLNVRCRSVLQMTARVRSEGRDREREGHRAERIETGNMHRERKRRERVGRGERRDSIEAELLRFTRHSFYLHVN